MDRRALFFVVAGLMCAALVPLADAGHRWVAATLAAVYVVLAACSALDHRSRHREPAPPVPAARLNGRSGS